MKTCAHCRHEKELSEFHKSKATNDGHGYHCKACRVILNKRYRADGAKNPHRPKARTGPQPCMERIEAFISRVKPAPGAVLPRSLFAEAPFIVKIAHPVHERQTEPFPEKSGEQIIRNYRDNRDGDLSEWYFLGSALASGDTQQGRAKRYRIVS